MKKLLMFFLLIAGIAMIGTGCGAEHDYTQDFATVQKPDLYIQGTDSIKSSTYSRDSSYMVQINLLWTGPHDLPSGGKWTVKGSTVVWVRNDSYGIPLGRATTDNIIFGILSDKHGHKLSGTYQVLYTNAKKHIIRNWPFTIDWTKAPNVVQPPIPSNSLAMENPSGTKTP